MSYVITLANEANRPAGDHLESDQQIQAAGNGPARTIEKKEGSSTFDEILSKMNDEQRRSSSCPRSSNYPLRNLARWR
jgi:hypothetical protein